MKKRFFRKGMSLAMVLLMVGTLFQPMTAKAAGSAVSPTFGTYAVSLEADPVSEVPDDFGTSAADGKVWADKSVVVTEDHFEVTLSALAQEYARTKTSIDYDTVPAADVTLILDITKSMTGAIGETAPSGTNLSVGGITYYREDNRAMNMIDAVNKTIDTIMEANPNNRIEIVVFTNGGNLSETDMLFLPMNHYRITPNDTNGQYRYSAEGTLTNGMQLSDFAGVGKYLEYVDTWDDYSYQEWQQRFFEIKTSAGLEYDNGNGYSAFSEKTITYSGSGTNAQRGAVVGIDTAINAVPNQRKSDGDVKRYPYVLFLTDGQSTQGADTWYSDNYVYDTAASNDNNRRIEIAAQMILAAAYKKDQLAERYTTYNGEETDVTFFTLGIGTDVAGSNIPHKETLCMLDPSIITSDTTITLDLMAEEVSQVANNISNSAEKAYVQSFASRDNFIYPSEREDGSGYYVYSATSVAQMLVAFYDLSELVASETNKVSAPIISFFTEQGKTVPCIVVTDYLGKGMELKGEPVINGVAGSEYTTNGLAGTPQTEGTNTRYLFDGIDTNVLYNPNDNTMTWYAYADDLAIIAFADRVKYTPGKYSNPNQLPVIVTYPVGVPEDSEFSERLYTGDYVAVNGSNPAEAKAYAEFAPETDDPYFFDLANGSQQKTFDDEDKSNNITKTAEYISTTAFIPSTSRVKMMLGNNGDLLPVVRITKDVNYKTTTAGNLLEYTIKVKNYSEETLTNVVILDTLPEGLKAETVSDNGVISTDEKTVTWTIASLEAGAEKVLKIASLIPKDAVDGTEYENLVEVTAIEGYNLATPKPSDKAKTVIVEPEVPDSVAKFAGVQYIFDGKIKIRFCYNLTTDDVKTTDAGLRVAQRQIVNGMLTDVITEIPFDASKTYTFRRTQASEPETYYYFEFVTAAKNMTDDIVLTYIDKDDKQTKSYTYNIRYYANVILKDIRDDGDQYDDLTKDMAIAMLNYGAYSQEALDYRTDYLVNEGLTKDLQELPLTLKTDEPDLFLDEFQPEIIEDETNNIRFNGVSLVLDDDIKLLIYLYSDKVDLSKIKATTGMEKRGELDIVSTGTKNEYLLTIDKVGACQLNDAFHIELQDTDFEMINFSPLSYGYFVQEVAASARGNEQVKNLMNLMYAMFLYNEKMQAYDLVHHDASQLED